MMGAQSPRQLALLFLRGLRLLQLALLLLVPLTPTATVLYVDPRTGSDAHSGSTPETPLRSLAHAQRVVRELRRRERQEEEEDGQQLLGGPRPLTVSLASGMYELPSGLRFDSPLDGGTSADAPTTWAAAAGQHPQLVGGISLADLQWEPAPSRGAGVWQASLPPAMRRSLLANVSAGAGRLDGEIVELQYARNRGVSPDNSSGSQWRRLWRARHPNLDHRFPTIWGGGYLTASAGIGSLPCAFRSPRVTLGTPQGTEVDCAIPEGRSYPAEPPRGMTFELAQLSQHAAGPASISNWTTDRAIVHVSTYARPPDQGHSWGEGYAWNQGNLQYTVAGVRELSSSSSSSSSSPPPSAEVVFELGGQQVNGYSWVLGAANIQNGSRWYMENVPEFLDAPSEFWHDVAAATLFVRPPAGFGSPVELTDLVAVTAQRLLDVGRRTNAGVSPIKHLHFQGLMLSGSRPTFLEEYEVPYRGNSDWTIHRGGAVTFEGVADVSLKASMLSALGGNAVFISNDAKNCEISGNNISDIGDSGVAIMGSMLRSTGLGARQFPLNVSVSANTIRDIGRFGKQVTGIFISTAGFVTATDNVISGSPSSGYKINDGFIGGHIFEYNTIQDVCRETTDMGAINLHNRDRFYYNFGTSIYDMTQADSKSPWASPFTGPNPRGPAEVDTIHPIHIRRNRLETVQKVGAVGVPGEWWGAQNSLFVLDIDDGNARYVIEENLLLATGSNGLKLGHIVDAITVRNNIVVARRGPAVPGGDPDQSPRQDLLAFNIGAMCMENTMNATRNVIVNLDGGRLLASSYGNIGPQALANGQQGADWYMHLVPKPAVLDYNLYYSAGPDGSVAMKPNVTVARSLFGLDVHSLIDSDPLLNLTDLGAVHVQEGSPALKLGFINFPYGPRI